MILLKGVSRHGSLGGFRTLARECASISLDEVILEGGRSAAGVSVMGVTGCGSTGCWIRRLIEFPAASASAAKGVSTSQSSFKVLNGNYPPLIRPARTILLMKAVPTILLSMFFSRLKAILTISCVSDY